MEKLCNTCKHYKIVYDAVDDMHLLACSKGYKGMSGISYGLHYCDDYQVREIDIRIIVSFAAKIFTLIASAFFALVYMLSDAMPKPDNFSNFSGKDYLYYGLAIATVIIFFVTLYNLFKER